MREPAFWWRAGGAAAALLATFAVGYGAVAARRLARQGKRAGIPVLCVGNPTMGGAGKTPTAILASEILTQAGAKPFLLSRGYGGYLAGPVRVDADTHRSAEVGDEPLLLARAAPTIVSRDRVAGAAAARDQGAGIIVMDDGFQNPSLYKDRSLLVIDARRGFGNGKVFPAGPLRAPLAPQLAKADALMLIGEPDAARLDARITASPLPTFHGTLVPDAAELAALQGLRVLAFTGIGSPDKFFATLTDAGIEVVERHPFPDHYRYTPADAKTLLTRAHKAGLTLITTEKDRVRLREPTLTALAAKTRTLPVRLAVTEAEAVRKWVLGTVSQAKPTPI
jgi:tetraacyldisaccharide 4'-kinase